MHKAIKPPIGITPEWRWKEQRIKDLLSAVQRYTDANVNEKYSYVVSVWLSEVEKLRKEIKR